MSREKPNEEPGKSPKGVMAVAPPSFRRERALMGRGAAVHALAEMAIHVCVDGRDRLDTPWDCEAVIGGDGLIVSIAAASIVAKVTHDRLIGGLAQDCPGFGFEAPKG